MANNVLHTLAGIYESSRKTLEYLKQECVREFEIPMSTGDKTAKQLCARKNDIVRNL